MKQGKSKYSPSFFDVQSSQASPSKNRTLGIDTQDNLNYSSNKNSTKSFMNSLNFKNSSSKKSNKVVLPINLKLNSFHQPISPVMEDSFYEDIYHKYVYENSIKKPKKKLASSKSKKLEYSIFKPSLSPLSNINKPSFQSAFKSIETSDNRDVVSNIQLLTKDLNLSKDENQPILSNNLMMQENFNYVNSKIGLKHNFFSNLIKNPIMEELNAHADDDIKSKGDEITSNKEKDQSNEIAQTQNKMKVRYLNYLFKDKKCPKSLIKLPTIFNKQATCKEIVSLIIYWFNYV